MRVVENSCTIKVPFLDALKSLLNFCLGVFPHQHAKIAIAIPWVCIRHSHVIFHELIINSKQVSFWNCTYSSP